MAGSRRPRASIPKPRTPVPRPRAAPKAPTKVIGGLRLGGFKSFRDNTYVELRPLTVLAGENSGGKSSIVQPLLLLKQTLEATHNPEVLELAGPCVKVERASELMWRGVDLANGWSVELDHGALRLKLSFCGRGEDGGGISLSSTTLIAPSGRMLLLTTDGEVLWDALNDFLQEGLLLNGVVPYGLMPQSDKPVWRLFARPNRCAHEVLAHQESAGPYPKGFEFPVYRPIDLSQSALQGLIHLPGLRGNPERAYRVLRVEGRYPGSFPEYTASVIHDWQERGTGQIEALVHDLAALRISSQVSTRRVDDTRVELRLGRVIGGGEGSRDLVNIADVGFGASQALPVVVALRAARPGQLVHIEQPELHLHPNAQVAMAGLLVAAVLRGARLVVETHSSVLLRALQVAIAEGPASLRESSIFHWLSRDEVGATVLRTAELGNDGSFGDWPVDFAKVEMDVMSRFITASAQRRGA